MLQNSTYYERVILQQECNMEIFNMTTEMADFLCIHTVKVM